MRTQLTAAVTAAAIVVALTGCSMPTRLDPEDAVGSKPAPAVEQEEEKPAEAEGTRANPSPVGSIIQVSDMNGPTFEVTIGAATLDAGALIAAENQFNEPAPAGMQFIMAPVTYTYVGADAGTPWMDVTIDFVSVAGTTHTISDAFIVAPNPTTGINEMYAGASATANIAILVPIADVAAGVWAVSAIFGSEPYFVKVV